jgi:hypothetical protein
VHPFRRQSSLSDLVITTTGGSYWTSRLSHSYCPNGWVTLGRAPVDPRARCWYERLQCVAISLLRYLSLAVREPKSLRLRRVPHRLLFVRLHR